MEKNTRSRQTCSQADRELLVVIFENLERFRKECGLKKCALASASDVTRANLWRCENGEYFPSIVHMTSLSRTLRVHMIELFLSPDELRRLLSELVRRYDIPLPESEEMPELDYAEALALNLLRNRRENGISLKDLAAATGGIAAYSSINRYESSAMPFPTKLVFPVSDALGVSPLELLTPKERLGEVVGILARKYGADVVVGMEAESA